MNMLLVEVQGGDSGPTATVLPTGENRITEDSEDRITEDGETRITE